MKYNVCGSTGLRVSQLGFGCGAVGGLLVRGDYPAMRQAVARAIELGINYFDTAPLYGNGQSEVNLGAVLRELAADVLVGSKVRLSAEDMNQIGPAVVRSVEASLRRLGRSYIDLIQVHNHIAYQRDHERLAIGDLDEVLTAFEALQRQGKVRFWGLTGLGESAALRQITAGGRFHTIQVPYNLLNPSAALPAPGGFPFQDYELLIEHATQHGMGVIVIRVLAGGALSGSLERHPVAAQSVAPIATNRTYDADVARAQRFAFLVEEGIVGNLVEAAIRFVSGTAGVSTALIGISSQEQLEQAVEYVERGPLPADVVERIKAVAMQDEVRR